MVERMFKSPLQWIWRTIPAYLPFYLLIVVVGYAAYMGWHHETVISAFKLPPENKDKPILFGGETVANTLQDALTVIVNEANGQPLSYPCDRLGSQQQDFGGLQAKPSSAFHVDSHVSAEVKGISVDALVSEAREVLGRERVISGDVLLDDTGKFQLTARANDAGPWTTDPQLPSLNGLKQSSCELAERILESTDKNVLAAALIRREDYSRVIQLYNVMPSGKGYLAEAFNNLGVALRMTNKLDDAIRMFHRALDLRAKFPEALYNLGNTLVEKRDEDAAVPEFQEAVRLKPDYSEAHCNLANVLVDKGEEAAAIPEYRKALLSNPNDPFAHNGLGVALIDTGNPDGAIAEYREAIRLKPNFPEARNGLGFALSAKGNQDAAIAEFNEALRSRPKYSMARNNLGRALFAKGEVDAAIAEFDQALQLNPNYAEAHYNLALALHEKRQGDEAFNECKKAFTIKPDLPKTAWCPPN